MNIELIIWRDAESESSEWTSREKAIVYAKEQLPNVESVGFILHETKDAVTLVHSWDKTNDAVTHAIKIPKKWIIKRKKL